MRASHALVLACAVASCGSPKRRGEIVGSPVIPATAKERRGEQLFFRFCAKCHPGGEAGLGPSLHKPLPAFMIETQIRRGFGAMPAFSQDVVSDAEVAAIASYVLRIRRTPPPEPDAPAPEGRETAAR
jgi:mono/diheme cytochrome c family protein